MQFIMLPRNQLGTLKIQKFEGWGMNEKRLVCKATIKVPFQKRYRVLLTTYFVAESTPKSTCNCSCIHISYMRPKMFPDPAPAVMICDPSYDTLVLVTRAHTKACVCRSLSVYIHFLILYKVRSMMIWCCRIKIWSMCKGIPVQGGNPWFGCRHELTRLQWGVQPTGVNQHAQTLCHLQLQPQCYLATTGHLHCLCWQIHLQPAKIKSVQSAKT